MNDLYKQLIDVTKENNIDLEKESVSVDEKIYPDFEEKISEARKALDKFKENNDKLIELRKDYLKSTYYSKEKKILDQFSNIINENLKLMNSFKKIVERIKNDVEEAAIRGSVSGNFEVRMKTSMHEALVARASELLQDFFKKQTAFKESQNQKVKHDLKVVTYGNKPPEGVNLDEMDGESAHEMLQMALKQKFLYKDANFLSDLQEKTNDIENLEKMITQLYQISVDLALLVEIQGKKLDQIEITLNDATGFVSKGNIELRQAEVYQKSNRKIICVIILLTIAVLGGVLGPLISILS